MVEGLGLAEARKPGGGPLASSVSSPGEALFQRRIEFHPARKPFSAIASSGGDFNIETLNPSSDSHRPAPSSGPTAAAASSPGASGKRSDGGEFYEHGLDPELSFQITFRRIGAGLANLGNTCFLNSVLQCLTYTEPFAAYLQSGRHKSSCHKAGFCAMCAFQNHVMIALQSTGKILSPFHFVKNLRCISRSFRNSRQEDAHEYMVNLLESMHKCCLPSGVPTESPSAYEKSLVHKIFGGRLRSQVKCTQCSYCSNKFDPFLDLSLEIVKADSLYKALSHFTAVEQLDGGEKQYQCQRCKQKVRALKQLTVHKAPYVLTIHLKRFGFDAPGQKIDKKVEFRPTLDLKPFVSDPHEGVLNYTLYGVLVHAGWSTHSGHYYCFVRTSSGMWYSLDDNQVFQVSEKTVMQQKAYMLFYFRNRRSSAPKRPFDVIPGKNIPAIASLNKGLPISSSALKQADQVCPMERRSSTAEHCLDISKAEAASDSKVSSAKDASSVVSLLKNDLILPMNNHVLLKEASVSQTSGHVGREPKQLNPSQDPTLDTSFKIPSLKDPLLKEIGVSNTTGKQLVAERLVQSGSSKDNLVLSVAEGLTKTALSKGNGVVTNSHHDDSPVLPVIAQITNGIGHLSNDRNVENKDSVILGSQQNKCNRFPGSMPEKLLRGTNMPEKVDAPIEKGHRNDTPCKMSRDWKCEKIGPVRLSCQSGVIDGCIPKEALGATQAEHRDSVVNERYPNDLPPQKAGGSVLKLEEIGQVNLTNELGFANDCVQKEALAKSHKECSGVDRHQTHAKPKKLSKFSFARNKVLGPRRLFLASLNLRKKKKHKRSKKRCLNTRNLTRSEVVAGSILCGQSTSTSEMVRMIDGDAMQSPKQQLLVGLNTKNGFCEAKDVKLCNAGSLNIKDTELVKRSVKNIAVCATNVLPEPSLHSTASQCVVRETNAHEKCLTQQGFMSMLLRGSENTKVAQWDDIELTSSHIHRLNDEPNCSIGYVLDEWDEEYDRGKRKKVKKSHHSFGGPNPFQEIAIIKAPQMRKMDQMSSGNRPPIRI